MSSIKRIVPITARWSWPMIVFAAGTLLFASAPLRDRAMADLTTLCGLATSAPSSEAAFITENDQAMKTMMTDMTIRPTGNVDHDFVAMMVPHHQGAIEMAETLLRYGHNEALRRLAQEIIVTQRQEIAAMRLALGEPLPPPTASSELAPDASAALWADSTRSPSPERK